MNYRLIAYAMDFSSFLVQNIEETGKVNQIILFGSAARGEASKDSDVDLFVDVLDKKLEAKIEAVKGKFYSSARFKKHWLLLGIKNEINCTVGKLDEWKELDISLISNGIVLFARYKGIPKLQLYYLFRVSPGDDRNRNVTMWRELYGYKQKVGKKIYEKKGLIRDYNGRKVARGVFIVPVENAQKVIAYLKRQKCMHSLIQFWQEA